MAASVALLAEPDRALRNLMHHALVGAGFEVVTSSAAVQVAATLRLVRLAPTLLCVLTEQLATSCEALLLVTAAERAQEGLPDASLILTRELGALSTLHIGSWITRGVLEKPFDLFELQAMAFESRIFFGGAVADGTRA